MTRARRTAVADPGLGLAQALLVLALCTAAAAIGGALGKVRGLDAPVLLW